MCLCNLLREGWLNTLASLCSALVLVWELTGPLGLASVLSYESCLWAHVWTELIAIVIHLSAQTFWQFKPLNLCSQACFLSLRIPLFPAYFNIKTLSLHVNEGHFSANTVVRSVAKVSRLPLHGCVKWRAFALMLAQAREQSKKALKGFCMIISVCLIPCGSQIEDGELRRDLERGCCQCFHTHPCRFLYFLSWPPWALTVTLLYHPWIINPFLKSPLWVGGLWALLSYWQVEKLRSWGIWLPSTLAM